MGRRRMGRMEDNKWRHDMREKYNIKEVDWAQRQPLADRERGGGGERL